MHTAKEWAKCVFLIRTGIILIRGCLAQRREEVIEHLLIREVMAAQDQAVVIGDSRENAVRHLPPRLIDLHHGVVAKAHGVGVVQQSAQHGAVAHVVTVDHRHGVAHIRFIDTGLGIQRTGLVVLAVQVAVQVIVVVAGPLHQEVALPDGHIAGAGDLDVGVDVWPRLLCRLEVHRHLYVIRLDQHHIRGLLRIRDARIRFIWLVRLHRLLTAARRAQRQHHHQGQQTRCFTQKMSLFLHFVLLSGASIKKMRDSALAVPHLCAEDMLPYPARECNSFSPPVTVPPSAHSCRTVRKSSFSAPASCGSCTAPAVPPPLWSCPF